MPGLLRMAARTAVVAGTASAVSGRVQHRQARRWQDDQAPAPAGRGATGPAGAAIGAVDDEHAGPAQVAR